MKQFLLVGLLFACTISTAANKIIHDAEYSIIEAQNGKKWAADDKRVRQKAPSSHY